MTAATAEAPTRIGWVPVPEHAVNRREQIPGPWRRLASGRCSRSAGSPAAPA